MINLLPPIEKELLRFERNRKLVLVLGIVILTSLAVFSLILAIVQISIWGEINKQETELLSVEERYKDADFLLLKDTMQKNNKNIEGVWNFYENTLYFAPILNTIAEIQKPKGVVLTSINIKPSAIEENENKQATVKISGVSSQREDLIDFRDNIESSENVNSVYFPPESWLKSSDIDFYVTFNIKKSFQK